MEVVHEASGEAARPDGAARVEIGRCLERNQAEAAHAKLRGDGKLEEQRVGPGICRESLLARIHGFSRRTDQASAASHRAPELRRSLDVR